MTLPPGTLLQTMYLKDRIRCLEPGRFIEIGIGGGHVSNVLLGLGWHGTGFEIDKQSAAVAGLTFAPYIAQSAYEVKCESWLMARDIEPADLIVSSMVLEHLTDDEEAAYLARARRWLRPQGVAIVIVPGSPEDWGVEDDCAGHIRRYTRETLSERIGSQGWRVRHVAGLTYPISNLLLPVSNYLVRRAESEARSLPLDERTRRSGRREVHWKTRFPSALGLLLNEPLLYPFHVLQKAFVNARRALVLYAEMTPASQ